MRMRTGNLSTTHATVRCEPGKLLGWPVPKCVLGLVDENYAPLQNREAFAFFDPIVGQEAAVYETAGALGQGERVWILAKLPTSMRVVGDDFVDKYLLLSNSHDGSSGVEIRFTPIRVVCSNTLVLAQAVSQGLCFQHSPDLATRLSQAAENINLIRHRYQEIESSFQEMVRVPMNSRNLDRYLQALFPDRAPPAEGQWPQLTARLRELAAWMFEGGRGNKMRGVRGTLWAAYNGATEMLDRPAIDYPSDTALKDIWFGRLARLKVRAYEIAMRMVRLGANATNETAGGRHSREQHRESTALAAV